MTRTSPWASLAPSLAGWPSRTPGKCRQMPLSPSHVLPVGCGSPAASAVLGTCAVRPTGLGPPPRSPCQGSGLRTPHPPAPPDRDAASPPWHLCGPGTVCSSSVTRLQEPPVLSLRLSPPLGRVGVARSPVWKDPQRGPSIAEAHSGPGNLSNVVPQRHIQKSSRFTIPPPRLWGKGLRPRWTPSVA